MIHVSRISLHIDQDLVTVVNARSLVNVKQPAIVDILSSAVFYFCDEYTIVFVFASMYKQTQTNKNKIRVALEKWST